MVVPDRACRLLLFLVATPLACGGATADAPPEPASAAASEPIEAKVVGTVTLTEGTCTPPSASPDACRSGGIATRVEAYPVIYVATNGGSPARPSRFHRARRR